MNKPKLEDYMLPVLCSFKNNNERSYNDIVDYLAKNYDLIKNDNPKRSILMINATVGYFLKSKLIESFNKGLFTITTRGQQLLQKGLNKIDVSVLRKFPEFDEFIMSRYRKNQNNDSENEQVIDTLLPEEKIYTSYELFKKNLSDEILEKLKSCTWQFFEILVKDLLVAMGYGDPYDEARITQGPGDEGIDGIIKADVLGLDIICIQAKKWDNAVGRPEIQKFAGSLESKRAKKGVFITTSTFTKESLEYVDKIEKKIVLIDGKKLAELMIDYDIGVSQHKKIILKKLDSDYFEVV